ncbi:MAG: hypothetical protein ACNS61_06465 [Candidatus Wenzhouxiangella sp. M2_3B_020]
MNMKPKTVSVRWIRRIMRLAIGRSIKRTLSNRAVLNRQGESVRLLGPDIRGLLERLEPEAEAIREYAEFDRLPSFGNQLMVEFAVYTGACDRAMRRSNIDPADAQAALSDAGWHNYRRMLWVASLPFRLVTRDPGKRIRWTIQLLLRFPFNAPGAPGYEVETRVEDDRILTHFRNCPPQSYIRRLSAETNDPDALEAFRTSWCLYDWPGADVIAGDGVRGHYRRTQTLSRGDPVCDMCWAGRGSDSEPE